MTTRVFLDEEKLKRYLKILNDQDYVDKCTFSYKLKVLGTNNLNKWHEKQEYIYGSTPCRGIVNDINIPDTESKS